MTAALLQAQPEDLTGTTKDRTLSHALEHGLGFLHETMSEADQELVGRYFTSGAIQVLVDLPKRMTVDVLWGLCYTIWGPMRSRLHGCLALKAACAAMQGVFQLP